MLIFFAQRCLGKSRAVRPSVSKAKETTSFHKCSADRRATARTTTFVEPSRKKIVLLLAFHLAERISSLFRQMMDHHTKMLYDPETEVLFLPQFWLLSIHRELLNAASTQGGQICEWAGLRFCANPGQCCSGKDEG